MGQCREHEAAGRGDSQSFLETGGQEIFVSPKGRDENPGTISFPVKTLERALELAAERRLEAEPGKIVEILLRGGVYPVRRTLSLEGITAEGTAPLRIAAYGNEKVRLSCGTDIPLGQMTKAESSFTDKVLDTSARDKILQYDLKQLGMTDFGEISRRGFLISENLPAQAELLLDGRIQKLAGWPNQGYTGIAKIIEGGKRSLKPSADDPTVITDGCSFQTDTDRPSFWSNPGEAWVTGVLGPNYFNDTYPVERFDRETKTLRLREGAVSDYPHTREFFRFENVPEELDAPGEYYIDRNSGILYYYPPAEARADSVLSVTGFDGDLMQIRNSQQLVLENLIFDGGRDSGITGSNVKDITIRNCEVYGFGGNGIKFDSAQNVKIEGCRIHDLGKNGIMITGGDYARLISGGNVIYNNDIYNFSRLERAYCAGVYLGYRSVGTKVQRNHIHEAPHAGIIFYGANHEFSGNELDHLVLECHDMNAIYANISCYPWERGNVMKRNYFHDFGKEGFMIDGREEKQINISAIRSDNSGSGLTVTENLFYNLGTRHSNSVCGIVAEGTRNRVERNLFVDCSGTYKGNGGKYDPAAVYTDSSVLNGVTIGELKKQMEGYFPVYGKQFPELAEFFDEHPRAVQTNVFCDNMIINIDSPLSEIDPDRNEEQGFRGTPQLILAEGNYIGNADPGFADYGGGDLSLTEQALNLVPGFPKLQMSDFGLIKE